ncbi:hypothetical protein J6590_053887 [Homalodisca vitripennis]|nr:hypothetical protein J6590_053887 [Homalodisca vitripennis]
MRYSPALSSVLQKMRTSSVYNKRYDRALPHFPIGIVSRLSPQTGEGVRETSARTRSEQKSSRDRSLQSGEVTGLMNRLAFPFPSTVQRNITSPPLYVQAMTIQRRSH